MEYVEVLTVVQTIAPVEHLTPTRRLTREGYTWRVWMPVTEWDTETDGPVPAGRRTFA